MTHGMGLGFGLDAHHKIDGGDVEEEGSEDEFEFEVYVKKSK